MCTSPYEAISRLLLELNHRSDRIMRLNNDEASGRDAAGRRRVSKTKWDSRQLLRKLAFLCFFFKLF